jgi:hypothetical protein
MKGTRSTALAAVVAAVALTIASGASARADAHAPKPAVGAAARATFAPVVVPGTTTMTAAPVDVLQKYHYVE